MLRSVSSSKSLHHCIRFRCARQRMSYKSMVFSSLAVSPPNHLPIHSLPPQYLRAVDPSNIDPSTMQRNDVAFDKLDGKPLPVLHNTPSQSRSTELVDSFLDDEEQYHVEWEDGLCSTYSAKWVQDTLQQWEGAMGMSRRVDSTGMTAEKLRSSPNLSMDFADVITDTGMDSALLSLYKYGILLVKDTPIDDTGLAALASALGGGSIKSRTSVLSHYSREETDNPIVLPHGTDGPLRTLYGTIWSTSSLSSQQAGSGMADLAFHEGVPLHTDMTYSRDPPGLQICTMIQPASSGGESIYCDGFAAAERLRRTDPEAFVMLSQTERRFRCIDQNTGWHLEASGPVISVNAKGEIVMIRHNDFDRLPDLPPQCDLSDAQVNEFYEKLHSAQSAWDRILAHDEVRLVIGLAPGETMVVANQRWMHGRFGFDVRRDAPRVTMGCFTGQDELNSRFRMLGYESH